MPIYEFKCHKCKEYIEILVSSSKDDTVEMKCSRCGSPELERILSTTSFNVVCSENGSSNASKQTRTCSNGSCTTWNLTGHSR